MINRHEDYCTVFFSVQVLRLLENGQLEILAGGWVMNDEANSHYYAILEQLITGHEWLNLNLNGYKPK